MPIPLHSIASSDRRDSGPLSRRRVRPRRRCRSSSGQWPAADGASTTTAAGQEANRGRLGIHRHGAVAAILNGPAGSGRRGHAHLRQVRRSREASARRSSRSIRTSSRPRCAAREANRAGIEADVQYWRQQVKRLESLVDARARSAARSSIRRRTRCAPRNPGSRRSTRRCAKGSVELQYYRVDAPQAGVVGDITIRAGDRVTTSTMITTIDDEQRARGLHPGAARSLAASCASGCRCRSSTPTARSSRPIRSRFVAPRVDDATQTVLVKSAAARGAAGDAHAAVHPLAHRVALDVQG